MCADIKCKNRVVMHDCSHVPHCGAVTGVVSDEGRVITQLYIVSQRVVAGSYQSGRNLGLSLPSQHSLLVSGHSCGCCEGWDDHMTIM